MMNKSSFNKYVDQVIQSSDLAFMRPVVEKELLHYEIFSALDEAGLLKNIIFQGGTALRLCRGAERYSEDLNFAGGKDFHPESMNKIKTCIMDRISHRFGLNVDVKEPNKDRKSSRVKVEKWLITVETQP